MPWGVVRARGQASVYLGPQKKFTDDRFALRVI